jgi:hypothetical protein
MTDKERLEKIKEKVNSLLYLGDSEGDGEVNINAIYNDMSWLIFQAEKAEYYEMKYENTGAIFNRRHMLDKIERYENAIKECIERMDEGGSGTRSFVYEKLTEVMEGTGCLNSEM